MAKNKKTYKNLENLRALMGKADSYFDGTILEYDGEKGVILDSDSIVKFLFEKGDLIESNVSVGQKVLYSTRNSKAYSIHAENSADGIMDLGKKWKDRSEYSKAIEIFSHLCRHDSLHDDANFQRETCKKLLNNQLIQEIKIAYAQGDYLGVLQKQKFFLEIEPSHEKTKEGVLESYPKAIKQCENETSKSSFRQEAKSFIEKNLDFFSMPIKRLQMAFTTCFAIEDAEHFEDFANKLQDYYDTKANVNQYCHFMRQRALMKMRQGDRIKALEYLRAIQRKNPSTPKIEETIKKVENASDDLKDLMAFFAEENNKSTLSEYSHQIAICDEQISVAEAKKEVEKLSKSQATTKEEKAEYLLKKVKLQNLINEDFSKSLFDYYCIKSRILFAENKMDSCRFLCKEGISIYSDTEECENLSLALIYIASLLGSDKRVIDNLSKKYDDLKTVFLDVVTKCIEQYSNAFSALSVLTSCCNDTVNNCIFEVLEKLPNTSALWNYIGLESNDGETRVPDISQIKDLWNDRMRKEIDQFNAIKMDYLSFVHGEELSDALVGNLIAGKKDYIHPWLTGNDKDLMREIASYLPDLLKGFLMETRFVAKKRRKDLVLVYFKRWSELGQEMLSDCFITVIRPFLQRVQSLLEESFESFSSNNTAELVLRALNNEVTVINNRIEIHLSIENTNEKAPFPGDIDIILDSQKPNQFHVENVVNVSNVNSQKSNFAIKKIIVVIDEADVEKLELQFTCKNSKTREILAQGDFAFSCVPESRFTNIDNKFTEYACGKKINEDSDMFYGRKQDIDDLVDAIKKYSSKHFLIYGQNRCGKSSTTVQVVKRLKEKAPNIICISFALDEAESALIEYGEIVIYHKILRNLSRYVRRHGDEFKGPFIVPELPVFASECRSDESKEVFTDYILSFKELLIQKDNENSKRIFIAIDEFSFLYSLTRAGQFPQSFMRQWKAVNENPETEFSALLVGQNVMELFMEAPYASNAFQSIESRKLTYLEPQDARALIEHPIEMPSGESRYLGKAVDLILEYTSQNPFYIQIFCNELVKYENKRKSTYITEADVFTVADELMKKGVLQKNAFKNLLSAGQPEPPLFPEEDTMCILTQIATICNELDYCPISAINPPPSGKDKEIIIKHLCRCDVLEKKDNEFKIVIRLYQDWLFQNRI